MSENLYCKDMKDNRKYRDNWERTFRGKSQDLKTLNDALRKKEIGRFENLTFIEDPLAPEITIIYTNGINVSSSGTVQKWTPDITNFDDFEEMQSGTFSRYDDLDEDF